MEHNYKYRARSLKTSLDFYLKNQSYGLFWLNKHLLNEWTYEE